MAEFRDPVDVEALLVAYFEQDSTVTAALGAHPAWTDLPRDFAPAPDGVPGALRVTSLGGQSPDPAGHVTTSRIQIDAFGAAPADAWHYATVTTTALRQLPGSGWRYPGAVVTSTVVSAPRRLPNDTTTAIPAYFVEVVLVHHPVAV